MNLLKVVSLEPPLDASALNRADIYTSHEGMHLPLESSLTRKVTHRWPKAVGQHASIYWRPKHFSSQSYSLRMPKSATTIAN